METHVKRMSCTALSPYNSSLSSTVSGDRLLSSSRWSLRSFSAGSTTVTACWLGYLPTWSSNFSLSKMQQYGWPLESVARNISRTHSPVFTGFLSLSASFSRSPCWPTVQWTAVHLSTCHLTSPGSPKCHPDCGFDRLIPTNLWCHPTISLPSAGGPSQFSPPIFGIVFLRTLPQHRRSRFSGSVSRLTSFGVLTLT